MKAIIAGTSIENVLSEGTGIETYETKYGSVDAAMEDGILFIFRHRKGHSVAPHKIDYRAHVSLLEEMGVTDVITTHAVGSISQRLLPVEIGLVGDYIDFTSGREATFFDGVERPLRHTEMTNVYRNELVLKIMETSIEMGLRVSTGLTYITTDGPRLESPAEIRAYRSWGADVVGMTLNPEVNLIHELGINVQSLAFSINWAAGLDEEGISFIEPKSEERLSENVFRLAANSLKK